MASAVAESPGSTHTAHRRLMLWSSLGRWKLPAIAGLTIVTMSFAWSSARDTRAAGLHWKGDGGASGELSALPPDSFTMVFMSDPQFDWGCGSQDTNKVADYCRDKANQKKSKAKQADETNALHIATIKAIKASARNFAGVVISGDLTAFGSKDDHLDKFKKYYMSMGVTVWPGLGNHDYENNVNDCGGTALPTVNYCGADMVQFLAGYARGSDNISSYDVTRYAKNPAQAQGQRNVTGSLAYSWDRGPFHFVQLNNYPTYTRSFTRGYSSGISSWRIKVTSPAEWLAADLKKAAAAKKTIILAWHRYDIYYDSTAKAKLIRMLAPYAGSIKAIFVGHYHFRFGQTGSLTFPAVAARAASNKPGYIPLPAVAARPEITVPIIYSGSAIFNRFIQADFVTEGGCTIKTTVINTFSGSPVPDTASNGGSGVYTIDCS